MQDEVFADIYIEIFPFWENISDGDRDYICRNSYHCIDTRADRPVYGVCLDSSEHHPSFGAFALQISCVIVPIGQYTHQERGLNNIMVKNPSTVEVSITL